MRVCDMCKFDKGYLKNATKVSYTYLLETIYYIVHICSGLEKKIVRTIKNKIKYTVVRGNILICAKSKPDLIMTSNLQNNIDNLFCKKLRSFKLFFKICLFTYIKNINRAFAQKYQRVVYDLRTVQYTTSMIIN